MSEYYDVQAALDQLRAEVAALVARVAELEARKLAVAAAKEAAKDDDQKEGKTT